MTGWNYFSNPRVFPEYGRQKGWEREAPATDTSNGAEKIPEGFVEVTEQMLSLIHILAEYKESLSAVQEDVKILREVRHWLNQVLPSEQYRQTAEPGKKPSIQQDVYKRQEKHNPDGTGGVVKKYCGNARFLL